MNTVTVSSLTTLPASKKRKSKLNQLWEEVEKKQRRNERYQAKLDSFHLEFKMNVEQQEQAVCLATEKWIHHLISFTQRKTIKGTQRNALYDWILEELSILEANIFNPINTDELRHAFDEALMSDATNQPAIDSVSDEELNAFREEISMMFGADIDIGNEQLLEMIENPRKFHDYLQELMAEKIEQSQSEKDDDIDWETDSFFSQDNESINSRSPYNKNNQALYSNKQMTKLYRQLAKQLHPDKEMDENKKIEKSALMQQLSQAKKDKDVIALLLMAQQYIPDHEIIMDRDMIERLQATLEEKIRHLNIDYEELKHGHDLKNIIWQRFGGGSKIRREKSLKQYCATLERETIELHEKCQNIKTVKQLQIHLKERIKASCFENQLLNMDPFELFFFDEDLF